MYVGNLIKFLRESKGKVVSITLKNGGPAYDVLVDKIDDDTWDVQGQIAVAVASGYKDRPLFALKQNRFISSLNEICFVRTYANQGIAKDK